MLSFSNLSLKCDLMHADEIIHHQRQEIEYMREQLHVQVCTALWFVTTIKAIGPD